MSGVKPQIQSSLWPKKRPGLPGILQGTSVGKYADSRGGQIGEDTFVIYPFLIYVLGRVVFKQQAEKPFICSFPCIGSQTATAIRIAVPGSGIEPFSGIEICFGRCMMLNTSVACCRI